MIDIYLKNFIHNIEQSYEFKKNNYSNYKKYSIILNKMNKINIRIVIEDTIYNNDNYDFIFDGIIDGYKDDFNIDIFTDNVVKIVEKYLINVRDYMRLYCMEEGYEYFDGYGNSIVKIISNKLVVITGNNKKCLML